MRQFWLTMVALLLLLVAMQGQAKYGSNPTAGATFKHDGVKLYYEVYGSGEPVLLIHGNGLSIASLRAQIEYFRQHYQVIAMDSRDHGHSADAAGQPSYEQMADDLSALLEHLKVGPAYVIGWSDGGIEALLLGIRHPEQVKKIAAMGANIEPSGADISAIEWARKERNSMSPAERQSPDGQRELRHIHLLLEEPHIPPSALETITAPTLVLAGDHDMIRDEHTVEIFHHLPNSELCIFPGSTHAIPYDNPELFNGTVEHFFRTPFVKRDRLNDVMKSIEKMEKE
jgi:pimeloyl-ACP methyl ester carboxylesterase